MLNPLLDQLQLRSPKSIYYLLTDSKVLAERAATVLGRDKVLYREESISQQSGRATHLEDATSVEEAIGTYVDWFMFRHMSDAIILMYSNFGYTAYAATGLTPVMISNNFELDAQQDRVLEYLKNANEELCSRRLKSHVHWCPDYGN